MTSQPAMANASNLDATEVADHFFPIATGMYSAISLQVKYHVGLIWNSVLFRTMQKKPSTPTRVLRLSS